MRKWEQGKEEDREGKTQRKNREQNKIKKQDAEFGI